MINRITDVEAPGNGHPRVARAWGEGSALDTAALGDVGRKIGKYIGDHPVMSLAIGFTLGIVVGCLVKRR